ncbi:hypothetical protein [Streptomyces sp. TP-A0874]|uniref:hypothetical protein n=1 Tax=Streptomyces sp. TP-A0874 TaxID=549819 RepID=UPI000853C698|nr:hypothetical protein [Streptomyces sp. TP-A0874]
MPSGTADERPAAPLPMRVRPHLGESTENYIRRLARANHLRPSALHAVVCGPPSWTGKPRLDRLPVLTGHPADHLNPALTDAVVPRRRTTVTGQYRRLPRGTYLLCRAIRKDAEVGLSLRHLAERHRRQQPANCTYCSGPLQPGRKNQIRLTCSASCRTKLYHRRRKERLAQGPSNHEP